MKYIKGFNENVESGFDLDLAITKIKEHFSEEEVISNYDEEILNWIEEDWADDYDSEYEWYIDHNNGEAQDVIISDIINWYKKEFSKELSIDDYSELHDAIKLEFNLN
jgi:hypothetical protein